MKTVERLLAGTSLFSGIEPEEIHELLKSYRAVRRQYEKETVVLFFGDAQREIGILLKGRLLAEKNTPAGGRVTFTRLKEGDIFGDVLAGSHALSAVTLTALNDSEILFLPYEEVLREVPGASPAHTQVLKNLVAAISDKYFALSRRLDLVAIRSLRERVGAFLLAEAQRAGNSTFTISYNREGMAAYLNCERSALSRELSRMKAAGAIDYYKSSFRLLDPAKIAQPDEVRAPASELLPTV